MKKISNQEVLEEITCSIGEWRRATNRQRKDAIDEHTINYIALRIPEQEINHYIQVYEKGKRRITL